VSGGGGGSSTLNAPVTVLTQPPGNYPNGVTVQCDITDGGAVEYGYFIQDASSTDVMVKLEAVGNTATLEIGNVQQNSSYFVSSQIGSAIGNLDSNGNPTNLLRWDPTDPNFTLTLRSPTLIDTTDASSAINNGITINCDRSNNFPYGIVIEDITDPTENIAVLVAEGDTGILQLGNSGGANAFFSSGPASVVIGNTDLNNTTTNLISWNPTATPPILKLNNPVVVTGPSGDGVIYDSIYNPPPSNPPVPIITSPTAPILLGQWANNLAPEGNTPYTVSATGLYLVTASVRISTGVAYNFPAGSILNLTPSVSGTQDPYNSMTFFLSSTGPQGNINTTQSGLGFYVQGSTVVGTLNQASTGSINLGDSGGISMYIQQVINQYP
jgi:hypothetical protein